MKTVLCQGEIQDGENVSWAAYNASQQMAKFEHEERKLPAISALLPLFNEEAKSFAMICHSMNVVKKAVFKLNPEQVPVIALDQPLYALAKTIQWNWPNTFGEDKFVIMFGGLHIEMAAFKLLGNLLQGSGWTSALVQAGIASSGTAESFLKASHVTRTRRAHQVTACALEILKDGAYQNSGANESSTTIQTWNSENSLASPQFKFWSIVLDLELTVLAFVRSIREANFQLYIDALTKLVPWFFTLDHHNYSRWLPVHLNDMVSLPERHPQVYAEFLRGNFTVNKTGNISSDLAIDHAYEQNNAVVKRGWRSCRFYGKPVCFQTLVGVRPRDGKNYNTI